MQKLRYPASQKTLASRIGKFMQEHHNETRWTIPDSELRKEYDDQILGVKMFADSLGLDCKCRARTSLQRRKGEKSCICEPRHFPKRRQKKR